MIVMHAQTLEEVRPLSNDERLGMWAARYFSGGYHRAANEQAGEGPAEEPKESIQ